MPTVEAVNAERARRARRRRLRSWIAPAVLLVAIAAVAVAIAGIANSWWAEEHPVASADQQAADGTSTFTQAGRDFFTRDGRVLVDLGPGALPASRLGLADGTTEVEFAIPLEVQVIGPDGIARLPLMSGVEIVVDGDRIARLDVQPLSGGLRNAVLPLLHSLAPATGWTDEQFAALDEELAARGAAAGDDGYRAELGEGTAMGVSATAIIDVGDGVTARYRFAPLD